MDLSQIFANNVLIFRTRAGLKQKELASLLGMATGYVGRLEKNPLSVSFSQLQKLAQILKVEPHELFINHVHG